MTYIPFILSLFRLKHLVKDQLIISKGMLIFITQHKTFQDQVGIFRIQYL